MGTFRKGSGFSPRLRVYNHSLPFETMGNMGAKEKTPAERMREYKRTIQRAQRELDRERNTLMNEEKKLIVEIKKMAKAGHMDSVKLMARDLVRTRQQIKKFYRMGSQLKSVQLQLQTLKAEDTMSRSLVGITNAMADMNSQLNVPAMQQVLREFERQNEKAGMVGELMSETLDGVMEGDDDSDEEAAVVGQVMAELGLQLQNDLDSATVPIGASSATVVGAQANTAGPVTAGAVR